MTRVFGFLMGTIVTMGLLATSEGRAAPAGALVRTFGNEGSVTLNTGFLVDPPGVQSGVSVKKALALGDRSLLLAGPGVLLKLAPDGTLDGRFGNEGVATHGFLDVGGLTVDSHGSIFIAGTETGGMVWSVRKFTPQGGVDESFVGRLPPLRELRTDLAANATAVVVQPDDKVVAVGTGFNQFTQPRLVVTRWQADGQLDPDFGTQNGTVVPDSDVDGLISGGMVLQPDGKLIISGQQGGCDFGCAWDATVLRLTSNGRPDRSFGTGGWAQFVFADAATVSVALQNDGQVVIAARNFSNFRPAKMKIARLTPGGDLDRSFGIRGVSTIDCDSACAPVGIAHQADGKLVVGATRPGVTSLQKSNFVALRLNDNGTLDRSYGRAGFATADFGLGPDEATAFALDSTGAAVVAGQAVDWVRDQIYLGALRFRPDGGLDPSFGDRGKFARVVMPATDMIFRGIALPRGGVLLVGAQKTGRSNTDTSRLLAVRLTARGGLQDRFGTRGVWTYSFGDSRVQSLTAAVVEPRRGKLILGGLYDQQGQDGTSAQGVAAVLLRILPDGRFDTTFAEGGKLLFGSDGRPGLGGGSRVSDLHLNSDGSLIVLTAGGGVDIWHITADGQVDMSFGNQGRVRLEAPSLLCFGNRDSHPSYLFDVEQQRPPPGATACRLAVQADGKILVAGYIDGDMFRPAIVRLLPDGKIDSRFGSDGIQEVTFVPPSGTGAGAAEIAALRVLPDRKILLAGSVVSPFGAGWDLAFARFRPNGKPDRSFSRDGKAVFNFGTTENQYPRDIAVQADGAILFAGASTKGRTASDPPGSAKGLKPLIGRLTVDGRLDRNFRRGKVRWDDGSTDAISEFSFTALTPNGTLITGGSKLFFDESVLVSTADAFAAAWSLAPPAADGAPPTPFALPVLPSSAPQPDVTSNTQ